VSVSPLVLGTMPRLVGGLAPVDMLHTSMILAFNASLPVDAAHAAISSTVVYVREQTSESMPSLTLLAGWYERSVMSLNLPVP